MHRSRSKEIHNAVHYEPQAVVASKLAYSDDRSLGGVAWAELRREHWQRIGRTEAWLRLDLPPLLDGGKEGEQRGQDENTITSGL